MKIRKIFLIILFILIILCLLFMSCFFHSQIYYVKFNKEKNENIGYDWFVENDDYYMSLLFPNVAHTFFGTTVSLETREKKSNLVECELTINKSLNASNKIKLKKLVLQITDLKNKKIMNVKEIYLNDSNLNKNLADVKKYVVDYQINCEYIDHSECDGFYHILYYYNDFSYKTNKIKLNIDVEWEYDNKSYSYSNEYLLKKKWEGLGFNICLD